MERLVKLIHKKYRWLGRCFTENIWRAALIFLFLDPCLNLLWCSDFRRSFQQIFLSKMALPIAGPDMCLDMSCWCVLLKGCHSTKPGLWTSSFSDVSVVSWHSGECQLCSSGADTVSPEPTQETAKWEDLPGGGGGGLGTKGWLLPASIAVSWRKVVQRCALVLLPLLLFHSAAEKLNHSHQRFQILFICVVFKVKIILNKEHKKTTTKQILKKKQPQAHQSPERTTPWMCWCWAGCGCSPMDHSLAVVVIQMFGICVIFCGPVLTRSSLMSHSWWNWVLEMVSAATGAGRGRTCYVLYMLQDFQSRL